MCSSLVPVTRVLMLLSPHLGTFCTACGAVLVELCLVMQFHHVAGVMLNSGANQRTLECSADGRCHTGKINPQISSLMDLAAGRCFHVQQHLPRQIISLLTLYTAVQALDKQLRTAALLLTLRQLFSRSDGSPVAKFSDGGGRKVPGSDRLTQHMQSQGNKERCSSTPPCSPSATRTDGKEAEQIPSVPIAQRGGRKLFCQHSQLVSSTLFKLRTKKTQKNLRTATSIAGSETIRIRGSSAQTAVHKWCVVPNGRRDTLRHVVVLPSVTHYHICTWKQHETPTGPSVTHASLQITSIKTEEDILLHMQMSDHMQRQ